MLGFRGCLNYQFFREEGYLICQEKPEKTNYHFLLDVHWGWESLVIGQGSIMQWLSMHLDQNFFISTHSLFFSLCDYLLLLEKSELAMIHKRLPIILPIVSHPHQNSRSSLFWNKSTMHVSFMRSLSRQNHNAYENPFPPSVTFIMAYTNWIYCTTALPTIFSYFYQILLQVMFKT